MHTLIHCHLLLIYGLIPPCVSVFLYLSCSINVLFCLLRELCVRFPTRMDGSFLQVLHYLFVIHLFSDSASCPLEFGRTLSYPYPFLYNPSQRIGSAYMFSMPTLPRALHHHAHTMPPSLPSFFLCSDNSARARALDFLFAFEFGGIYLICSIAVAVLAPHPVY
ncbi:hypothetical protein PLICRDRAFT_330357 [Plicaturopsis crispa FD-325 SS-3]|uniref:Uncharacterized protein n=1 Tax=Plicaturopsis crispa FD-325 SS-3 TaxID=944288 RepID=A0A0C9T9W3_PLICR|nr:hypothetical protein PLICRDRAFT_330357 [Plicaturopsis crispa FD-325 SS-3]